MTHLCKGIGCTNIVLATQDFCPDCLTKMNTAHSVLEEAIRLSEKYPKYYKSVEHLDEVDVYAVHHIFDIQDPSGAIQHASKKLLLSGVRTGGKSKRHDIEEARDTLSRWLQLNPEELLDI